MTETDNVGEDIDLRIKYYHGCIPGDMAGTLYVDFTHNSTRVKKKISWCQPGVSEECARNQLMALLKDFPK